ncbi:hypothetical protein CLOM_g10917 [Closterium sp. NIES-68]|nr:hypothetical protein CLOM_g10917 [Closterium sp. NIES-68]GJP57781.1 hypothetical protein CLOP_g17375 [Closterium sp. NIES-67]
MAAIAAGSLARDIAPTVTLTSHPNPAANRFRGANAASQVHLEKAISLAASSSYSDRWVVATRRGGYGSRRVSRHCPTSRRQSCRASVATEEHAAFLRDVAAIDPPPLLSSLIRVLQAQGEQSVSPSDRRGMVPLAIPLTRNPATGAVTALLRWPTAPPGMQMPVICVGEGGGCVLVARSADEYIQRALVEEDVGGKGGAAEGEMGRIREAAGEEGRRLYSPGEFAASKSKSLDAYLTTKVGMFPDVLERLALRHLEQGDQVSALVAGEFYARKHFPGFAHPFTFNAQLLLRVGRPTEARDAARIALKSPWWTLGASYQEVAELAGYGDSQLEYALERLTEEGRKEDVNKGKAPEQVALDQAAFLLDVAAAEGTWEETCEQLAGLYREAGLEEIARFVLAGP